MFQQFDGFLHLFHIDGMQTRTARKLQSYDPRLRQLIRSTGNLRLGRSLGIPDSTLRGWVTTDHGPVVGMEIVDLDTTALQAEVVKLRERIKKLGAIIRLLVALLSVFGIRLSERRLPDGEAKAKLLRSITRSASILSLASTLKILRLSPRRYHAWQRNAAGCGLADLPNCPRSTPQSLTREEINAIRGMVESENYRHVPTSRLAILAQRIGGVFASPAMGCRLVKIHGWRRPRGRVHPGKPKQGIRASRPDEIWHIDTRVLRLLDKSKVNLHAVVDNFSRCILSWCIDTKFDVSNTVKILREAAQRAVSIVPPPQVVVDAGVEDLHAGVNAMVNDQILSRVVALNDIEFANSLIETLWRVMKHQWLFLHPLDSVATVNRLVAFYVPAYNGESPTRPSKVRHRTRSTSVPEPTYRPSFDRQKPKPAPIASTPIGALTVVSAVRQSEILKTQRRRRHCSAPFRPKISAAAASCSPAYRLHYYGCIKVRSLQPAVHPKARALAVFSAQCCEKEHGCLPRGHVMAGGFGDHSVFFCN